jgi:hypothetical protein
MNSQVKKQLLDFHFGSVSETDRLLIEQELLLDSEMLVDYLDLKRQVEAAYVIPPQPSLGLWEKMKPKTQAQRRTWISLSVGAALAAGLALFFAFHPVPQEIDLTQPTANNALFDSSSELPVSSGVL